MCVKREFDARAYGAVDADYDGFGACGDVFVFDFEFEFKYSANVDIDDTDDDETQHADDDYHGGDARRGDTLAV